MKGISPPKPMSAELGLVEDEDGIIRIDDLVIPASAPPTLSNEALESRLIITHIVARNFKSYAGEQVIGPFNKSFTAIVGPNGSGKSNVIDSLMFVFGHKATKIRAKKISALIHNSDNHPNVRSCSVAVNFAMITDEGESDKIIPDSRFVVSRTVNADGSSYYEINNKRKHQREVVKLLRAYGIDMEYNRFLIMQGEIESIALMDPVARNDQETGMLEYIEDIVGSNRLIEPIKYLKEKVDKFNIELKEKHNQLKLIEEELKRLEIPKNEAVDFLRLQNKLYLTENSMYQLQKARAEDDLLKISHDKEKYVEEMKIHNSKMEELHNSKKKLENEMKGLTSEHNKIVKIVDEYKEKYVVLEREDAANLMEMKHTKEKFQSLENNFKNCKVELDKLRKQMEIYESETGELQLKKKKLEEEKQVEEKKAHETMSSLKQETNLLQQEKDKLELKLGKLKDNVDQIQAERNLAQSELNLIVNDSKKENDRLADLTLKLDQNKEGVLKEEKSIEDEGNRISTLESEIVSLKIQLTESKQTEVALIEKLENERVKYHEAKQSQQTSVGNSLVKGLLNEKAKGRLPGVYGRLGDLGAIDEKYDVAISTACGRLENIVTDTMSTAQSCVEFLKKNNKGYATFIAMDQMKKYEHIANQKISTPENVPRLFDLVRVKDKALLPAFYFALGNTLVAKDLEQATRIGLQGRERHRVVTLKGEVIDLAGTMSGGGGKVFRGRMGQSIVEASPFTEADIAQINSVITSLTRKLSEVKSLCVSLNEQIVQKNKEVSTLRHSVLKRNRCLSTFREKLDVCSSQIVIQKKKISEVKIDKKEISKLEEKIKQLNESYLPASKKTSAVEEQVSKLQEEILKISHGKLGKVQKTVDQLVKKVKEVFQALSKSSANMKQSKTKMRKLEDKMKDMEKESESNKTMMQKFVKQKTSFTTEGLNITMIITENQEKLADMKEKVAIVKKEMESFSEKEHQFKQEEVELKNTLKTYVAKESEQNAIIRSLNAKLNKLKLNSVEDDATEIPTLSKNDLISLNAKALSNEIELIKVQLEEKKPDFSAIEEFKKKEKVLENKEKEVNELTRDRDLQSKRHEALRIRRYEEFGYALQIIKLKLKEIYQMLTMGGDAELEYVDSQDIFGKGIEFSVRPVNKSWKAMKYLSGGEKTLSSLALVFSLHYYRPTPFYVMDEIDAALDERNVGIVGHFLKDHTKNAQFIIVSLRNVMNELSDHLLGIYKVDNCTYTISLNDVERWDD